LENGIALTARAVIIAAPAIRAAHILQTLAPAAAAYLAEYRYDPVARVALGIHAAAMPRDFDAIFAGAPVKFVEAFAQPARVPPEHVLLRVGVRLEGDLHSPSDARDWVLQHLAARGYPITPVLVWTQYWETADPLTLYVPEHAAMMDEIESALPREIALIGNDYRARKFDQRVTLARAAARRIVETLT
jgi:protoporphyrinogen oxidase